MTGIEQEHPEYAAQRGMLRQYRDLYSGGEQFKERLTDYLLPRHKEPGDVYGERLQRAFYENYVGSIVDWYAATLFRREPVLAFEGINDGGRRFFAEFLQNCDLRGASLSCFFRRVLVQALVSGKGYVLIDLPPADGPVATRADEEALGRSRAYLVDYSAEDVINWSHDRQGRLEWAVLRTTGWGRSAANPDQWVRETRWQRYDRERFELWRQERASGGQTGPLELVAAGRHALANQQRVPLFELQPTEGLWLLNKAASLQLEHFNKANALSWALTMGLYAMPVVYTNREFRQILGESYYVQLGPEDKFGWTEPEGHVFEIAAANLQRLKEEIYRVCFLLSQASGSAASLQVQSGLSKQRDYAITQEVLRAYGDEVKDTMRSVLQAVSDLRDDGLVVAVSGLDEFDIGDFGTELADAQALLGMSIPSMTLRQQVYRRLAQKYLCDASQEVKDRIMAEIDAGMKEAA